MALTYLLVALVSLAVGCASEAYHSRDLPCPNDNEILPCVCSLNDLFQMTIDCSGINTNKDLERVFNATFPFNAFYSLIIDHKNDPLKNLTEIRSDVFHFLNFERVRIIGTNIEKIEASVFSYSHDTLKQIELQDNRINDFPFETIALYTKLQTLVLENNQIPVLEKFASTSLKTLSIGDNPNLFFTVDVLEELPNLVNLNMKNIDLKMIPPNMFVNATKLFFVNFNDNDLTIIEEFTFNPTSNILGRILLANNRIYKIIPGAFSGLMEDTIIDMANNEMELMQQEIWQPVMDLFSHGLLELSGNPLTCGCDMSWMFLNTSTSVSSEIYLPILTDHTTCYDGSQVAYLDKEVFKKHCTI